MPYSINWLIENEIIYAKFWGSGDANELRSALIEINQFRDSSPRDAVHIITDTKDVVIPVRFQDSMKVIKEFEQYKDRGWEIVVGDINKILKLSLSISRSILRTKSITFKTMDEAFNHLKKEDSTLNWHQLDANLLEDVPIL